MNITTMFNKRNNTTSNDNNDDTTKINLSGNNNNTSNNNNNNNNSTTSSNATITTDRIEWSRATILDFIEDYRRQRVLWDPNTKGYHIKQTKYEALKLLGHKYGAEIRSIRSKIKSLRSSFHREHGKVLNGRRKGLNYQPMWFAYDAIRFILDGESGDSDEAETQKSDTHNRSLPEPKYISNTNNNIKNLNAIDEELLEERKISNRDIEHFNNHFLALGLQARHPMAVIAAVEAAAAASAAQERCQEQKYALKQQEIDSATQLKLLELSTNTPTTTTANTNATDNNTMDLTSTTPTFNPISKPFNSPKSSSPLATITSGPITTATLSNTIAAATTTTTNSTTMPTQQQLPPPSSTSTCSLESLSVLHGSRSLDENTASALGSSTATAIPSLSITAVARNSDFDSSEYCNISADDVKTEIFESDTAELMLGSARTSTPVPINYHKKPTDLTVNKSKTNNISFDRDHSISNVEFRAIGSRKRKMQMISNVNLNEEAPTPSKLQQKQHQHQYQQQQQQQQQLQHSISAHSRQSNFLNGSIKNYLRNPNDTDGDDDDDDDVVNGDDDDEDGAGYSNSFSHLQTTLINSNSTLTSKNKINNNNHNHKANSGHTGNDEYGVFGEYVAITIRKLKTSKAKIVVKHLINNLLYEAEMGKYDQGMPSCKEPPELYKM